MLDLSTTLNDELLRLVDSGRQWLASYGLGAVAIGVFTETLLFTGVVVPGFAILLGAGYLSAAGVLSPVTVFVTAWLAAGLGDQVSYGLSKTAGKILLKRHHETVSRLKSRLEREGRFLLLTYHYSPVLRAIMPCVVGTAAFPFRRWLIFDTIGVGLWVATLMGLGSVAHGALASGAGTALQVLNAMAFLLTVYVGWRFTRRLEDPEISACGQ